MAPRPRLAPGLAALLVLAAGPAHATDFLPPPPPPVEPAPRLTTQLGLGGASLSYADAVGHRIAQQGVSVELKVRYRRTPRFGVDYTLTWGLTDWDRAREWIDAGNQAGSWTTDRIQAVGDWAMEDERTRAPRLMGALFADMFLVMTYAAVPFCYVGSVAGATSHLQADVTAGLHTEGPVDGWVEGGLGAVALPVVRSGWDFALGPVVGIGAELGPLRIGARFLWAPSALHTGTGVHGTVATASATVSLAHR